MRATITRFDSDRAIYGIGDVVYVTAVFSEAVEALAGAGGFKPRVVLSNGGIAHFDAAATQALGDATRVVFAYEVKATDRATRDLDVIAVSENGGSITTVLGGESADVTVSGVLGNGNLVLRDAGGVAQDSTVTVNVVPVVGDQVAPQLVSMNAAGGVLGVGTRLEITVTFNEAVVVSGGVPTLKLVDGDGLVLPVVASYVGGSGTRHLVFSHEVVEGDPVATGLDVSALNLNGGSIRDYSGNAAVIVVSAGQNNLAHFASVGIDGVVGVT